MTGWLAFIHRQPALVGEGSVRGAFAVETEKPVGSPHTRMSAAHQGVVCACVLRVAVQGFEESRLLCLLQSAGRSIMGSKADAAVKTRPCGRPASRGEGAVSAAGKRQPSGSLGVGCMQQGFRVQG